MRAQSNGRGSSKEPRPTADGDSQPARSDPLRSVGVDVDVDLVGDFDACLASANSKLVAEHEQKHENDNDEKRDRKNAAASAASGFYDGRVFALGTTAVIIGHGNSPCLAGCLAKRTNCRWGGSSHGSGHEKDGNRIFRRTGGTWRL